MMYHIVSGFRFSMLIGKCIQNIKLNQRYGIALNQEYDKKNSTCTIAPWPDFKLWLIIPDLIIGATGLVPQSSAYTGVLIWIFPIPL